MRRVAASLAIALAICLPLACSDDGDGSSSGGADATTAAGGDTSGGGGADTTLAPTTTFMPTCAEMPPVDVIFAAVGVPVDEGTVVATGTCQYLGVNDQSLSVLMSHYVTDLDIATFLDLQASLGPATPVETPAGAAYGPDGTVFLGTEQGVYAVQTMVTGGPAIDQVAQSAALLAAWLGG
ncbi:MAG: hypothetical protein R2694_08150 [Ilumatobacteraceae bacterium]